MFATLRGEADIVSFLAIWRITPQTWIVLREEDERFDEAAYVTNKDGLYCRLQTGMLDELFGYIAGQATSLDQIDEMVEDYHMRPLNGDFDKEYERVVVPANVEK